MISDSLALRVEFQKVEDNDRGVVGLSKQIVTQNNTISETRAILTQKI